MIRENSHKYNISAMCKVLGITRSAYYYKARQRVSDTGLEDAVIEEFHRSRNNYGTRKLKVVVGRMGFTASRRRIGRIMERNRLVSNYTLKLSGRKGGSVNSDGVGNLVNREFDNRKKYEVVVSDLTYIRVAGKWRYLCLLLDLCGRKILGSAVGTQKNARLVEAAFYSAEVDLRRIKLFHTDRGSEFKNRLVEGILEAFGIGRSLSAKGTPYDNAVAESMYSVIKTEFAFRREYADIDEFKLEWFDYVNWYNNVRIHGSLGYKTPSQWHEQA